MKQDERGKQVQEEVGAHDVPNEAQTAALLFEIELARVHALAVHPHRLDARCGVMPLVLLPNQRPTGLNGF